MKILNVLTHSRRCAAILVCIAICSVSGVSAQSSSIFVSRGYSRQPYHVHRYDEYRSLSRLFAEQCRIGGKWKLPERLQQRDTRRILRRHVTRSIYRTGDRVTGGFICTSGTIALRTDGELGNRD